MRCKPCQLKRVVSISFKLMVCYAVFALFFCFGGMAWHSQQFISGTAQSNSGSQVGLVYLKIRTLDYVKAHRSIYTLVWRFVLGHWNTCNEQNQTSWRDRLDQSNVIVTSVYRLIMAVKAFNMRQQIYFFLVVPSQRSSLIFGQCPFNIM